MAIFVKDKGPDWWGRFDNQVSIPGSKVVRTKQPESQLPLGSELSTFRDFSAADLKLFALMPFTSPVHNNVSAVELHGLTLLSVSTDRSSFPVLSTNSRTPKSYTKGHRMVAGSLGFNTYGNNPFEALLDIYNQWRGTHLNSAETLPDELPPFDLNAILVSHSGDMAGFQIKGVQIIGSARNIGIQDIELTEIYSYTAMFATNIINYNDRSTIQEFRLDEEDPVKVMFDQSQTVSPFFKEQNPPSIGDILGSWDPILSPFQDLE